MSFEFFIYSIQDASKNFDLFLLLIIVIWKLELP